MKTSFSLHARAGNSAGRGGALRLPQRERLTQTRGVGQLQRWAAIENQRLRQQQRWIG